MLMNLHPDIACLPDECALISHGIETAHGRNHKALLGIPRTMGRNTQLCLPSHCLHDFCFKGHFLRHVLISRKQVERFILPCNGFPFTKRKGFHGLKRRHLCLCIVQ